MEKRTVEITIDTAKDWYRSNIECLKTLALQAFTEKELEEKEFEKIKSFEDALEKLGISIGDNKVYIDTLEEYPNSEHLIAIYKLDIIRKALNGEDFKPSHNNKIIYYPGIAYYTDYESAQLDITKNADHRMAGTMVIIKGNSSYKYYIIGGGWSCRDNIMAYEDNNSLGKYDIPTSSCCKSKEIAMHMSRYFMKEIFAALYLQDENYVWL
jgi:hypothetical protein